MEKRVLELALNEWSSQKDLQASFMANVHKDVSMLLFTMLQTMLNAELVHDQQMRQKRSRAQIKNISIMPSFTGLRLLNAFYKKLSITGLKFI